MSNNYYYPEHFNENTSTFTYPVFNSADWNYLSGYATLRDLLSYANLFKSNIFSATNYFSDIFASSVNGVPNAVFQYLTDISENVQEALTYFRTNINNLLFNTTNLSYNSNTNSSLFNDNLVSLNSGTINNNAISGSAAIAGQLVATKIQTGLIQTDSINANNISCGNINCGNLFFNNDIGVFLFVPILIPSYSQTFSPTLILIPLSKSQNASNLINGSSSYFMFHIKPNYRVEIIDNRNLLI